MQLLMTFYKHFTWDHKDVAPITSIIACAKKHPYWKPYMPKGRLELIMTDPHLLEKAIQEVYNQDITYAEEDPDYDYEPPTYELCEW